MESMCETCIFRPGNAMDLEPGRVLGMVRDATKKETAIVCHKTLSLIEGEKRNAVCRGFFDLHQTLPIKVAISANLVEFVDGDGKRRPGPIPAD